MPTQSRALPGPLATVTVAVPPLITAAGVAVTVAEADVPPCTVIVPLVASTEKVSFAKKRRLYVPADVGAVKVTLAAGAPTVGAVWLPFKYFQSIIIESGDAVA